MELQEASRKKVKIKCALQGPSSSGKTKSGLYIAYGLCGSWEQIAVIDTENRSSELYSDIGNFKVLHLAPPFSPERYSEALQVCIEAGMKVVIIDSLTHEWEYILDSHSAMIGNSFTNWSKLTPRHNAFVNTMLQADVHIIGTIRTKQDYVLSEKNGKVIPEKIGLKGVQRDGIDYEFTLVFDLDMSLHAKASKDRTRLFFGNPEFIPGIETGKRILEWCNEGIEQVPIAPEILIQRKIEAARDINELTLIYNTHPQFQESHLSEFTKKRQSFMTPIDITQNYNRNGTATNK